jgi:membrane protein DedA with SNARE-associated domain/rhodanese-related sulfurtransferase
VGEGNRWRPTQARSDRGTDDDGRALISEFFAHYGLISVFGLVLLEQIGLPIPATPVLLFAGARAFGDPWYGIDALAAATFACTIANLAWFGAGRLYGHRVLKLLCRLSLSPDSCVRQTEDLFERRGVATLVTAKFLPGLTIVAPPMAAALGFKLRSFLFYNTIGSMLYCATLLVLGLVFHSQIEDLLAWLTHMGGRALVLVATLLALYVAWRAWDRWRFLKTLRTARIDVDELHRLLSGEQQPIVLDVRSRTSRQLDGRRIPGARPVDLDRLEHSLADIPRDREVIVYCACPNEASAVKVALQLRQRGVVRVRPLAGGIDAWVSAGRQTEPVAFD